MDHIIDEVALYVVQYLYNELTEIVLSYLVAFNVNSLIFKKSFGDFEGYDYCDINIYKNKVYLLMCKNGLMIIYDMITDKTIYFNTNLEFIYSFCNIDDNEIIFVTDLYLYIYKYDIIDTKISILDIKQIFNNDNYANLCYFKGNIIFKAGDYINIHNLKYNSVNSLIYDKFSCWMCLYNEYLHVLSSGDSIIRIYNMNDKKFIKSISLPFDFSINSHTRNIFVDNTGFYIEFSTYINVFNYDGEYIRRIDKPYLNSVFHIDSDKIYLVRKFEKSIDVSIFQQKLKYVFGKK